MSDRSATKDRSHSHIDKREVFMMVRMNEICRGLVSSGDKRKEEGDHEEPKWINYKWFSTS